MKVCDSPGQDTNPSQFSPQQKLVLIYTAELTGASRVKCLAQGHTMQWSGRDSYSWPLGHEWGVLLKDTQRSGQAGGSYSRPLGHEWGVLLKDTQCSGQAGVHTHDLWVMSEVSCSRTHNAVVRPGFILTTFGSWVRCLAQGHTMQWSGRGSYSRPLGHEWSVLLKDTQCSGQAGIHTHDLWVMSEVSCSRTHNAVVRPGFILTTFGSWVRCLAQGHTMQWSGRGSYSRPLGHEWSVLLKDTQCSGQAGVHTQDLWVMSEVSCSRTHNAVVRPGFILKTFGSWVKCLAQGHTMQWSGRGSYSRPLGHEWSVLLKDTQCSGQAGVHTHDLWVMSEVSCSRTHNAVVRPGFILTTFGLWVRCLAQGHTMQWSGRGSYSRPLGHEWGVLLKDTQCSGQAGVHTQDLWVMSEVSCSRTHNAVVRPGFILKTFGLWVRCLAQGHTMQWSGRGSYSRPLGHEWGVLLKDTQCSGQAGVHTQDLWVMSEVSCSRTHNAVVRPGFILTTFGSWVRCLAQGHTMQWSGRGSYSRPLGHEWSVLLKDTQCSGQARVHTHDLWVMSEVSCSRTHNAVVRPGIHTHDLWVMSEVSCSRTHNAVVRPGFILTTFGSWVKCLAQGHTMQWSGQGSYSRPLGYEWGVLLKDTQCSGQARVHTHDLWVMSEVSCSRTHNAVVRPGFILTTFGSWVKCLAQGHTMQWSGQGSYSRPLGYEWGVLLKDTQCSGQARVHTHDLWVMSEVSCSRTHNAVVRPGFILTTFGSWVRCLAQGHTMQWSGQGSYSRPLGHEWSVLLKDTQCSGQAGIHTHDLWVMSEVSCSRTHNAVVRPGFILTTFGSWVKCLAQGHTMQWSGRDSYSWPLGHEWSVLLKDTQCSGQARVHTHDLWVMSEVSCSRTHNAVVRPGFILTTFGSWVRCLAQGHTMQWSGQGSYSRPLGHEWSVLLKDTQCSGQAGIHTHDLWVMSEVSCSRIHNAVIRPGFILKTFGSWVKCLAQGYTMQWSGRDSYSRPLGHEWSVLLKDTQCSDQAGIHTHDLWVMSEVSCSRTHNAVVRPGFILTTFGSWVKCLAQGYTMQWSGRDSYSRPLGHEWGVLLKDTQCSGQAGVHTHDLWVMSEVSCSRTHNAVVRPGFILTTFGSWVKCLAQGYTMQWSGRDSYSRPLGHEWGVLLKDTQCSGQAGVHTHDLWVMSEVSCSRIHNAVIRPGFILTTFGSWVRCLAQGHTMQWSGQGSYSRPLGHEWSVLLKDTQCSDQAGIHTHDLWVMSEVSCSRTHNAVVRPGFILKTFGSWVKCLAQGHTMQWSGRDSYSRPLGHEWSVLLKDTQCSGQAGVHTHDLWVTSWTR